MAERVANARELLERYAAGERDFAKYPPWPDLSGEDLRDANLSGVHLGGANLSRSNLSNANLSHANLGRVDLSNANLSGALLGCTNFFDANLSDTLFSGANLSGANLSSANLNRADLRGTNLYGATLPDAIFVGAQFEGAQLGDMILVDHDLAPLIRARLEHRGATNVGWRSIVRSAAEQGLENFLRDTGMPEAFAKDIVVSARKLDPEQRASALQRAFISYGGPDVAFARKLSEALKRCGVATFVFADDAPPGEKLHRIMRDGVNDYDRMILICSEASLHRSGLLNELELIFAREARAGGQTYLLPVRLDDYVLTWKSEDPKIATEVRDRYIVDFSRHDDDVEFGRQVARLIAALKQPATQV